MRVWMQWLVDEVRARVHNERGQDVIVVLLIIFLLWLLFSGRKVFVQ
ncbi:MAG TPA: hypothetical protein VGA58_07855 [bacterium]